MDYPCLFAWRRVYFSKYRHNKFTRGSWSTVEGNASGKFIPNRIFRYDGNPQTIRLDIAGWEDRDTGGGGTAAPNVFELDGDFYIPQLNRKRRIWIYSPPDGQHSEWFWRREFAAAYRWMLNGAVPAAIFYCPDSNLPPACI